MINRIDLILETQTQSLAQLNFGYMGVNNASYPEAVVTKRKARIGELNETGLESNRN